MNIKTKIVAALTLAVLVVPGVSLAQTTSVAALQAQLKSLLAEVQLLEAQIAAKGNSTSTLATPTPTPSTAVAVSTSTLSAPVPTVSISANPTTITASQSVTLTWLSTNATACNLWVFGPGGNTPVAQSGTLSTYFDETTTSSITCTGPGGTSAPASVTITTQGLPPASVTTPVITGISPTQVSAQTTITVSGQNLQNTNQVFFTGSNNWSDSLPKGFFEISPDNKSLRVDFPGSSSLISGGTYHIDLEDVNGLSSNQFSDWAFTYTPSVTAAPTGTISVSPTTIAPGQSAQLSWTMENGSACGLSGDGVSIQTGFYGWWTASPTSTGQHVYTLTCGKSTVATTTLTVASKAPTPPVIAPVPTVTISANPTTITVGQSATLTWSSTNATSCTASGSWLGSKSVNGLQSVTPTSAGNAAYTITCTGSGGSANASVNISATAPVATSPVPTVAISANPTTITAGQSATLKWSSTNATSCSISGFGATGYEPSNGTTSISLGYDTGTFTYRMVCSGPGGTSNTASATITINNPPPAIPIFSTPTLTASANNMSVNLSWTASTVSGGWGNLTIASYKVYRSTVPGFTPSAANQVYNVSGLSYTDDDIATPGNYYYAIVPVDNNQDVGPVSNVAQAVVGAIFSTPTLTASANNMSVNLSWTASTASKGIAYYEIYRSTVPGFTPSAANQVYNVSGLSYTDDDIATPGNYYYAIVPVDNNQDVGPVSNIAPVVVAAPPAPTVTITVSPSSITIGQSATLKWSSTNAAACSAFGGVWSGSEATSGTQSVSPSVAGTNTYSLVCVGPGTGATAQASASLSVSGTTPTPQNFSPVTLTGTESVNAAGQPIVNFSWTAEAASSNLLEYFIYEGMTPGFTPTSADIFSATPSNTLLGSYVLSSTPGTYYFAIAPRDTSGNMGPASNIVSLTVGAGTSIPPISKSQATFSPVTLTGTQNANIAGIGQVVINLSWTAEPVTTNFMAYKIFRSTTPGFTPSAANEYSQMPAGILTAAFTMNNPTGTYYYAVAPEDTSGNMGPASNIVSLTMGAGTSMSSDANNQTAIVSQSIQGLLDQLSVLLRSL